MFWNVCKSSTGENISGVWCPVQGLQEGHGHRGPNTVKGAKESGASGVWGEADRAGTEQWTWESYTSAWRPHGESKEGRVTHFSVVQSWVPTEIQETWIFISFKSFPLGELSNAGLVAYEVLKYPSSEILTCNWTCHWATFCIWPCSELGLYLECETGHLSEQYCWYCWSNFAHILCKLNVCDLKVAWAHTTCYLQLVYGSVEGLPYVDVWLLIIRLRKVKLHFCNFVNLRNGV